MSTKMNGGMKIISLDGTRVLDRDDPEIHAVILAELKTAEKVEIVSTHTLRSLVVRVAFLPDKPSGFLRFFKSPIARLRDDVVDAHGRLMQGDERWLPTTGKPIREVILKCVVVHPQPTMYQYSLSKWTCTMEEVQSEYMAQHAAFDATKRTVPISPDVIELLHFPDLASFDETFSSNPIYNECLVFQKLRECMTTIPGATIAMIMMESVPASYKPLQRRDLALDSSLIAQVSAMCVVLFHKCKLIALDAHLYNWLYDKTQPEPLRVKLIDYGLTLNARAEDAITKIIENYFQLYPDDLQQYLKLMGARPDDSPSEVMHKAIRSVYIPETPLNAWVHKIFVISMLIDGFFNSNPHKKTCQMSVVFNVVYDDACESMNKMLQTLSLELPAYLEAHPENAARTTKILTDTVSYMETYYSLRSSHADDDAAELSMDLVALARYGGKKMRKRNSSKRKRNKKKSIKSRKNKMHRK
jgi:hypothetical protein